VTTTLRRAVEDDADAVAAITVAGWRYAYRGIVADERLDAMDPVAIAEARRALIAAPEPTAVFVAEEDGRVVGYCAVGPPRRPDLSGGGDGTTGELAVLYLDPAVIGRGIGGALHDAGVAHLAAAGFRRAVLWVYAANTAATGFYAHRGWHAAGAPIHPEGWGAPGQLWARELRSCV
jgi:ribosomal protein S18 acetylase RimI-like enzyme